MSAGKINVLLVEDDQQLGLSVELYLKRLDYEVWWIQTGTPVIPILKEHQFDVLILDLGLPGDSGESILSQLNLWIPGAADSMVILVMTGKDTLDSRLSVFSHGAIDYLIKPIKLELLQAYIHQGLRRV